MSSSPPTLTTTAGPAAFHRGLDDRAELAARGAFDDDVGGVAKLVER
ncbi:hypothetical protein ACVWXL_005364 [Bradyrhizobium sp. GM22.5]